MKEELKAIKLGPVGETVAWSRLDLPDSWSAPAMAAARTSFEEWARSAGKMSERDLYTEPDGRYAWIETKAMFRAWCAALSSPPAQAEQSGWQPIETAPKDKSYVLLGWGESFGIGFFDYGKWWVECNGDYLEGGYGHDFSVPASFWMPIPPLPTPPKGQA